MLTSLDETLLHQTPEPFGIPSSSDHRFFDRNWFGCFSKTGDLGVITGIGVYPNMNVCDGFASVQIANRQYNVRASRPLRPDVDRIAVGPIHHDVIEPLECLRLTLEPGDHGVAFDLTWRGTFPAHLEPRHSDRLDGRSYQDYSRFDQMGSVTGWVEVAGERHRAEDWVGVRDHSWGVRRSVGGFEPFTGSLPPEINGSLFIWTEFATPTLNAHFQLNEDGTGARTMIEGFIASSTPDGGLSRVDMIDVAHDLVFHDGTRVYRGGALTVRTADGRDWAIELEPVLAAWAYRGTGYDNGFDDGKGLGVFRGSTVEHDCYDVSHPEQVVTPAGVITPFHREQHVRVRANGEVGYGHSAVMPIGRHDRYGFAPLKLG